MSKKTWANSPISKMIKDAGLDKALASEADSTSETPRLGYCMNPRSISAKPQPIASVLRQIASGENCDGEPYDQMQQAGDYIEQLERELAQAIKEIGKAYDFALVMEKQLAETQSQQWQPIETYPKNGKEFFCIDTSGNIDIQAHPMVPAPEEYTHWMPLPEPPTENEREQP